MSMIGIVKVKVSEQKLKMFLAIIGNKKLQRLFLGMDSEKQAGIYHIEITTAAFNIYTLRISKLKFRILIKTVHNEKTRFLFIYSIYYKFLSIPRKYIYYNQRTSRYSTFYIQI